MKLCCHISKIMFSEKGYATIHAGGKSLYPRLLPVCEWILLRSRSRCTVYMVCLSSIREEVNVICPSRISINYPWKSPWGNPKFLKNTHIFHLFRKIFFLLQLLPPTYLLCCIVSLFTCSVFIFRTQPSSNYFWQNYFS